MQAIFGPKSDQIKHEMQQIMNGQVVENPTTMEDDKDETVVVAEDKSNKRIEPYRACTINW